MILPNLAKNCMKLKEFGPPERGWARVPRVPFRSVTGNGFLRSFQPGERLAGGFVNNAVNTSSIFRPQFTDHTHSSDDLDSYDVKVADDVRL